MTNVSYPDYYDDYNFEGILGVTRWRWWRWNGFHEAMHIRYTPPDMSQQINAHVGSRKPGLYHILVNIMEDKRVNTLSVEHYRGMESELPFIQKLSYDSTRYDETPVKSVIILTLFNIMHEAVCGVDGGYNIKPVTTIDEVFSEADRLYDSLAEFSDVKEEIFDSYKNNLRNSYIDLSSEAVSDDILTEYRQIIKDSQSIEIPGTLGSVDKLTFTTPQIRISDTLTADTQPIIDEVVRKSKDIMMQVRDYQSDHGEFICDDYVMGEELYYEDSDPSVGMESDIFLLLDYSASISKHANDYAKAFYITYCALQDLRINVKTFIMSPPNLYHMSEDRECLSEQLSAIRPRGGTPLSYAIEMVRALVERKTKLVIITDGYPADPNQTSEQVRRCVISGMPVRFLSIKSNKDTEFFSLVGEDHRAVGLVERLEDIPDAVIELLKYLEEHG